MLSITLLLCGCASHKLTNQSDGESLSLTAIPAENAVEKEDLLAYLPARGLNPIILFNIAKYSYIGIRSTIDAIAKKYVGEYQYTLNNLRCYSEVSFKGVTDPSGLALDRFRITRTVKTKEGYEDLAMYAEFSIDRSRFDDLYSNGMLYLKLDSLNLYQLKTKINQRKWYLPWMYIAKPDTMISLDIVVEMMATWRDHVGTIHKDQPCGSFHLTLRNIPFVNRSAMEAMLESKRGTPLNGSAFLPPRSVMMCPTNINDVVPCYGTGDLTVKVTIKELSEQRLVRAINKMPKK